MNICVHASVYIWCMCVHSYISYILPLFGTFLFFLPFFFSHILWILPLWLSALRFHLNFTPYACVYFFIDTHDFHATWIFYLFCNSKLTVYHISFIFVLNEFFSIIGRTWNRYVIVDTMMQIIHALNHEFHWRFTDKVNMYVHAHTLTSTCSLTHTYTQC